MSSTTLNLNRTSGDATPPQTFTIRPFPNASSHKTFLRVILHRTALSSLGLRSGELCQISTIVGGDGDDEVKVFPAVAWLSSDPHVQRHIAVISDDVKGLLGIGFDSKVHVGRYTGRVVDADKVVVREGDGSERLGEGWKWFLEHIFVEIKYIHTGLMVPSTEYKGARKRFRIEKITGKEDALTKGHVTAYRTTLSTTVELAPPSSSSPKQEPKISTHAAQLDHAVVSPSKTNFLSIGGLTTQITTLKTLFILALRYPHLFTKYNLTPPHGILLSGPPGTGKTLLLKAIASEIPVKCYVLDGSVMGKYLGESEAAVRKVFAQARKNQPALVFIDDVDKIAPKQGEGTSEGDGRIVPTLLTEMDRMANGGDDAGQAAKLLVVAATNRPSFIDPALRRPGRFDREVEIGAPNVGARREILEVITRDIPFECSKEATLKTLAARAHGFVGADLEALIVAGFISALGLSEAVLDLSSLTLADMPKDIALREDDIESALRDIRPTAMREISLQPPEVRWADIGGQEEVKQRLRETVEWPLTHADVFARLGGTPRKGLLLYGPPGCSKTLAAKALATEAGVNFMAVKGPELLNMYVGESERAVREVFRKARAASPSIIFFDEIDALSARGDNGSGKTNVLTTLLNEMDGIEVLQGVTILAATNQPEIIDAALVRPGRFDTILYVAPPDLPARKQILQIKARKMSIAPDVDLDSLAEKMDGFSGAEVVSTCDEAMYCAMRESFGIQAVCSRHLDAAFREVVPKITPKMREAYENWSVGGVKKI